MGIEILPLSGTIGAEIKGIDLTNLEAEDLDTLRRSLLNHAVICIRDQDLSPSQQINFAAQWGEIHLHPYLKGLSDHPEIMEIVKEAGEHNRFGDHWHTDQIFTPTPAMATMLYAKEVPPAGGDTLFASLTHAYATLSDGMKTMVDQLSTVNQYDKKATRSRRMTEKISEQDTAAETAIHPLVRVHPETGKPALYLTAMQTTRHFAGLTPEESRPLIEYLLTHATRPEFTCRLRWRPGTLGIWDNRCLLHMALDDYPNHRRVMHRITLKGGPVVGIGTSRVLAE